MQEWIAVIGRGNVGLQIALGFARRFPKTINVVVGATIGALLRSGSVVVYALPAKEARPHGSYARTQLGQFSCNHQH